ncbi:YybH family protein [Actinophytocola glycyrrhizae]|uniref:YybH family protein n=1 Tax=Actinophytocola glycyrrhizae TaxID=2044873 RepID=A0ABV9SG55_9PSEU
MTDEQQIRDLIEHWASAVHNGDLSAVLADHATDIVMFDVPPPEQGVRGIEAYRETWPGFFEWQASGAVFEIDSLDVTAGTDVAFAVALLRCGTPADLDRDPEHRLRLTVGLTKVAGRWVVTHEHHSFADTTGTPEVSDAEVRAVHEQWFDRTAAKDLDGLMEHVASDIVSYEHTGPLRYTGIDEVREVCRRGLQASPGPIEFDIPDLTIRAYGDLAVAWGLDRVVADGVEIQSRGTRVFQRRDGVWQMIHQHLSVPAPGD